jgi:DNA-binding Lrp family transcriptional regulator
MDSPEFRLLNEFQREFPLCERPYLEIGQRLGESEQWVLANLARLQQRGTVGRVGAVFAPNTIGVSTLAAFAVAAGKLESVAEVVNSFPEVNHNYEREHAFNLWFVVTAADCEHLARTLTAIEQKASSGWLLSLPLVDEYRIDLGFDLRDDRPGTVAAPPPVEHITLDDDDKCLLAALQEGLALVPRPYAVLAECSGLTEPAVLVRLRQWQMRGVIRRLGVIVRHRRLGFEANAMVVWDVPDDRVVSAGRWLAQQAGVTLCYRRERRPPAWNYNLFCMIHGRERTSVLERVDALTREGGLEQWPRDSLFSVRAFKQCGARYIQPAAAANA